MNLERTTNLFRRTWMYALLIGAFTLVTTAPAVAQIFQTLHSFVAAVNGTNSDAFYPPCGLVIAGEHLYGAAGGSTMGEGTVFLLNTNGSGFTNLHSFSLRTVRGGFFFNSDGAELAAPLLLSGDLLYGSASAGGEWGNGVLFSMRSDGADFNVLYTFTPTSVSDTDTFTNSDGASPQCRLVLADGVLYGTTQYGGLWAGGTVFKVGTNGTGFKTLYSFAYSGTDGSAPQIGLLLVTNVLYGVTPYGGTSGIGTVFAINTNGGAYRTVHSFSGADGAFPAGQLIESAGILYGTTVEGGAFGSGDAFGAGTVFAIRLNGTNHTILHSFKGSDGAIPSSGLLLFGNILYGTTVSGGSAGWGTVFQVNIDGTGFKTLHNFTGKDEGAEPVCDLVRSGTTLYGTARSQGSFGGGTVFSIALLPDLTIAATPAATVLSWSTNLPGFSLQSAANLKSPIWSPVGPSPVILNGRNFVTNQPGAMQQFFRLTQ